jgi:hypothetical protein
LVVGNNKFTDYRFHLPGELASLTVMRSLGIDLAAQTAVTAYCTIQWYADMALVETPVCGADDDALVAAMERAAWTGIDVPFGWPESFTVALGNYLHFAQWPAGIPTERLQLRGTDRAVRDVLRADLGIAHTPPSVSSTWIALSAWRCAELLRRYYDRTGHKPSRIAVPLLSGLDGWPDNPRGSGLVAERGIVEVYPPGALAMWGLPYRGYKAVGRTAPALARQRRQALVARLETVTGGWLVLASDVRDALVACGHCLDAFISALVAFAAATDCTLKPTVNQRGLAYVEGWIHLPTPGCLWHLAPGGI